MSAMTANSNLHFHMDTNMSVVVVVEKHVAMALWFLASGADYRTIAHLFGGVEPGIGVHGSEGAVKEVCQCIVHVLLPQYIAVPMGQDLRRVVEGFEHEYKFPQCAGAVDGMHIPIQSPTECPADYYNRKGWHSVLIQSPTECPADYYNRKGWHSVLMHGVIDHSAGAEI